MGKKRAQLSSPPSFRPRTATLLALRALEAHFPEAHPTPQHDHPLRIVSFSTIVFSRQRPLPRNLRPSHSVVSSLSFSSSMDPSTYGRDDKTAFTSRGQLGERINWMVCTLSRSIFPADACLARADHLPSKRQKSPSLPPFLSLLVKPLRFSPPQDDT